MAKQNGTVLSAFDQVNREIQSDDGNHIFWWDMFGQSLATLLKTCQYSEKDQLFYLRWFRQWVLQSLGQRPLNGIPHYQTTFTVDGSPLEYSLNWKEKAGQTVRFTFEPCYEEAGTSADPLNQLASKKLLTAMAKEVPGIDLTRFNIILEETNVPNEAAEKVVSKLLPGIPRVRVVVAFDLEKGGLMAKAYYTPILKAIHTGVPTKTVAFDAIRKCNGKHGSYDATSKTLGDWMDAHDGPDGPQVFLMSHDCVADSPASRIKVYVLAPVRSLAQALDTFSLGGRLSGSAIEAGLGSVRSFWCHLFGLDMSKLSKSDIKKDSQPEGSRCLCVYEMRPSTSDQPGTNVEVKLHMPGAWLGQTDAKVSEVLSSWFQKHGGSDFAARYQNDLAATL